MQLGDDSLQLGIRPGEIVNVDIFVFNVHEVVAQIRSSLQTVVLADGEGLGILKLSTQLLPERYVLHNRVLGSLDVLHGSNGLGLVGSSLLEGFIVSIAVLLRDSFALTDLNLRSLVHPVLESIGTIAVEGQLEVVEHGPFIASVHTFLHTELHGSIINGEEHLILIVALLEVQACSRWVVGNVVGKTVVRLA